MYGRILNTIINIVFITYLLLLISFYFLHEGMRENISNINYSVVDAVAIAGQFSEEQYNNLKERIISYNGGDCDYQLTIKYEKKTANIGIYETSYIRDTISVANPAYRPAEGDEETILKAKDPNRIITTDSHKFPMHKGDKITIYLEDMNQTLYGKLISAPFMGMLGSTKMFNITSLKASIIGRDANNLVNGFDLKQEINSNARTYDIQLFTEASGSSSYTFEHDFSLPDAKYDETNTSGDFYYSVNSGEIRAGKYHIFNSGSYYREQIDNNGNGTLDGGDLVIFYETIS